MVDRNDMKTRPRRDKGVVDFNRFHKKQYGLESKITDQDVKKPEIKRKRSVLKHDCLKAETRKVVNRSCLTAGDSVA